MTNHTNPIPTNDEILGHITRTVNEFIRRAADVGPEQAMEEAEAFHPGAAVVLARFFAEAARS